jgi:hypothetical protein
LTGEIDIDNTSLAGANIWFVPKARKNGKPEDDRAAAVARLDELRASGQVSTEDYIKLVAGLSDSPGAEDIAQPAPSVHQAAFVGLSRSRRTSAYRGDLPSVLPQPQQPAVVRGKKGRGSNASTIAAAAAAAGLTVGAKHVLGNVLSSGAEEQVASGVAEAAGGFDWASLFDGL